MTCFARMLRFGTQEGADGFKGFSVQGLRDFESDFACACVCSLALCARVAVSLCLHLGPGYFMSACRLARNTATWHVCVDGRCVLKILVKLGMGLLSKAEVLCLTRLHASLLEQGSQHSRTRLLLSRLLRTRHPFKRVQQTRLQISK